MNRNNSRRYIRDGIESFLLIGKDSCHAKHLTASLVEMKPNGFQDIHSHDTEQSYFILQGNGLMTVGNETAEVIAGDCIFIPSNTPHGLKNTGNNDLRYFSSGSPIFGKENELLLWPLAPLDTK